MLLNMFHVIFMEINLDHLFFLIIIIHLFLLYVLIHILYSIFHQFLIFQIFFYHYYQQHFLYLKLLHVILLLLDVIKYHLLIQIHLNAFINLLLLHHVLINNLMFLKVKQMVKFFFVFTL